MASQKPNQPQGRQNGGAAQGVRDNAHEVGERIQQGASAVSDQVQQGYGVAREELAHRYRQAEGMIARNPGQSVLIGFGVGLGLGVLLSALVSRREESSWYDQYVPDSLRGLPKSMSNLSIPDSLRDLPERFRSGAESIARHIPGR